MSARKQIMRDGYAARGIAPLLLAALTLAGCSMHPGLETGFGDAYRSAVAEQVLHPERADRGGTPVEGLDGVRAARAVQALQAGPAKDGGQDSGPSSDPAKSLLGGLGSKK